MCVTIGLRKDTLAPVNANPSDLALGRHWATQRPWGLGFHGLAPARGLRSTACREASCLKLVIDVNAIGTVAMSLAFSLKTQRSV